MSYQFKNIEMIPNANHLVDIVLSKTNRKTPTIVHQGYAIHRIRRFYMRKVKFTQQNITDKLTLILDSFPRLDDIHPFYADLMNILYDKDHYKLALGHINKAKSIVDSIAKDYVRLMKYADSLYRSKMLKRAALGRMCTSLKKLNPSLNYLEEVRKHLARMPGIDPNTRTLIITGFPNVGKSSFINNVTNANVDVQEYPFTTQNLFVGHTEYKFAIWQVIDTPGLLDHPLEEMNTIEMQAVTALAHLNACILYFIDISERCGHSIEEQIGLFKNIKPLFSAKPLVIVLNKTDLKQWEELEEDQQKMLTSLCEESNAFMIKMSNKSGDGIMDVRNKACDVLLDFRLSNKAKEEKKVDSILNRIHVAMPKKKDDKERPVFIPETVTQGLNLQESGRPTIKDMQEKNGGAGVFRIPTQAHFMLEVEEWRNDMVPETFNGKNVADFIDPDIMRKLEALEREEEMLEKLHVDEFADNEDIPEEIIKAQKEVRKKRTIIKGENKMNKKRSVVRRSMNLENMEETMAKRGISVDKVKERLATKQSRGRKRLRGEVDEDKMEDIDDANKDAKTKVKDKIRSLSRSRLPGTVQENSVPPAAKERVLKKIQRKWTNKTFVGEADRTIQTQMPKHLFSGKRKAGKTDRR